VTKIKTIPWKTQNHFVTAKDIAACLEDAFEE